jgi:hypothetical protein
LLFVPLLELLLLLLLLLFPDDPSLLEGVSVLEFVDEDVRWVPNVLDSLDMLLLKDSFKDRVGVEEESGDDESLECLGLLVVVVVVVVVVAGLVLDCRCSCSFATLVEILVERLDAMSRKDRRSLLVVAVVAIRSVSRGIDSVRLGLDLFWLFLLLRFLGGVGSVVFLVAVFVSTLTASPSSVSDSSHQGLSEAIVFFCIVFYCIVL